MSSIINNSNANSALVNTINASESRMNPNIYSTKTIYPAAATVYTETQKSSGTIGASQSITFDLMKYGIAQQILLCYTKVGTGQTAKYDFLDVIDRVELLSASKVIDTLTNRDILAQLCDLSLSQYYPLSKTLVDARSVNGDHLFCLPLIFGFFKDINTNLNLQFNEPMSIRLRFGANPSNASSGTQTLTKCYLKMRYKAYNEADFSEILTQNYSDAECNIMTTGFYDENVATTTIASGTATNNGINGTPVELRNTDCVNDFFIVVREQNSTAASAPLPISRVVMTASGQDIFDLSGEELYYSRLCENGFSLGGPQDDTRNVAKVQVGLWEHLGSGSQSNTVSLRELNNPVIRVYFDVAADANNDRTYDIVVAERTLKIVSTVSSSGRMATSLTN